MTKIRCKVCGHEFEYNGPDALDKASNTFAAIGQIAAALGGNILTMAAANNVAKNTEYQVKCPKCRSTNVEAVPENADSIMTSSVKVASTITINANASIDALLKRAEMFLEDEEWDTAIAYYNQILDADPENSIAYLGKLMADLHCRNRSELQYCKKAFDNNTNYKKAIRYGDKALNKELADCIEAIKAENERKKIKRTYDSALCQMQKADTEKEFLCTADIFKSISGYMDSEKKALECREKANIAHNDEILSSGMAYERLDTIESIEKAVDFYKMIPGWKNVDDHLIACQKRIEEIKAFEKKKAKLVKIGFVAIVIAAICLHIIINIVIPNNKYKDAVALLESGEFDAAIAAFETLGKSESVLAARYAKAETLYNAEDYIAAAMTFGACENYKDAWEQSATLWNDIASRHTVSAGWDHAAGIRNDGSVIAVGNNEYGKCNTSDWNGIIDVSAARSFTVGLTADGTVVAVGDNEDDQCDVSEWKNIVAISAGDDFTVVLKADGTIDYEGKYHEGLIAALKWKNIVSIAAGEDFVAGLKDDGTVVTSSNFNGHGVDESKWKDIVAISADNGYLAGLKADGTVVIAGKHTVLPSLTAWDSLQRKEVAKLSDIVDISLESGYLLGLKKDGTVVVTPDDRCDLSEWENIVAISAGNNHTVGLKSDGTAVAVGYNEDGQCDVGDWTDIKLPN